MKKPSRRDHPRATARRSQGDCQSQNGSVGPWEFNVASESLFPLGLPDGVHRVAYRTADGQVRFLPL